MFNRRQIIAYTLFGVAALGMIASLFLTLWTLIDEQRAVTLTIREDIVWNATQAEIESRQLLEALLRYAHDDPVVTLADVTLRFDVVWSRVDTISHGELGAAYRQLEGGVEAITEGRALLAKTEPSIKDLARRNTATVESIDRDLSALIASFRKVRLRAHQDNLEYRTRQRQHYGDLYSNAIVALGGALLSGGALVLMIVLNMRSLNTLRATLEARVAERTRALSSEIGERERTENALARLSQALQQSPVAVVIFDSNGVIEYANPKFAELTRHAVADSIGRSAAILHAPELPADLTGEPWVAVSAGGEWHKEYRQQRKDGSWFWIDASLTPIRNGDGAITHFLFVGEDVSLRKHQEERLLRQATIDEVSGLPNRVLAQDRLLQALANAHRQHNKVGLLLIDLDSFKQINDTLGHHAGDQLLRQVSERFTRQVRTLDTVARFGGDEFVVVLHTLAAAHDAELVANKILATFAQPFLIDGQEVFTSASIGVAVHPEHGEQPEELLRNADAALYLAKDAGRGVYRLFTPEINTKLMERATLEKHLRHALERDELSLVYQPIIDLESGDLRGYETLLRWQNPELGEVAPARFIALAEEIGVSGALGRWVLERACRQAKLWRDQGASLRMAINFSPRQLRDEPLVDSIRQALQANDLPPQALDIEISENQIIEAASSALNPLQKLIAYGIRVFLDDFGAGYSSLQYIKQLPITGVKIDQAFIANILTDSDDAAWVKALIAMARSMNLVVVAEGVESAQQLRWLKEQGCDEAQGFLFRTPVSVDKIDRLIADAHWRNRFRSLCTTDGARPARSAQ